MCMCMCMLHVHVHVHVACTRQVGGSAYLDRGCRYEMRVRSLTFYTSSHELSVAGGAFATVAVPSDANVGTFSDQMVISLRSAWLGHEAGSLLAAPVAAFMAAEDDAARGALLFSLFAPTDTCSLLSSSETKNYLVVSALEDVVRPGGGLPIDIGTPAG